MKIELKLSNDTIIVCDRVLSNVYDVNFMANSSEKKVILSIVYEVADMFDTKCKTLKKKADLFNSKKKHKMTLKYYQAWALYSVLLELGKLQNDYQQKIVEHLCRTLDQKLA